LAVGLGHFLAEYGAAADIKRAAYGLRFRFLALEGMKGNAAMLVLDTKSPDRSMATIEDSRDPRINDLALLAYLRFVAERSRQQVPLMAIANQGTRLPARPSGQL
jgi:hypothetical protein